MSISGDQPVIDTVRALEDDFADAMSRMYSVGNDLARLRARLVREESPAEWSPVAEPLTPTATQPAPAAAQPAAHPVTQPTPEAGAPRPGQVTPPPAAQPPFAPAGTGVPPLPPLPTRPPATPWWQREGIVAKVLAVVGTGITLIGVAFLLALAIQMGFFGPLARVLSGALLAVGLLVAAAVVRHRQQSTVGALGLAATGIATAYLDVLAVTRIYEWVPEAVGLALAGLVGLGGLLLARAWSSQLLGVIAVLGVAALAPAVGYDHLLLTGAFLVVLTIASWPAQIGRDWFVLELARIAPTALFLTVLVGLDDDPGAVAALTTLLAGFVLATSLAGARIAALPQQLGVLPLVVAMPMAFAGLAADNRWVGSALLVVLTCLLVLVAGLADETPETALHHRLTEIALGTAGLTSLLAALRLTEPTGWALPVVLALTLVWTVAALALRHRMSLYVAMTLAGLSVLGAAPLLPHVLLRSLADEVGARHLVSAIGIVVLLLVLAETISRVLPVLAPVLPRVLVAGSVLAAGGAVIFVGVLAGHLVDDPRGGFTAGQTGATLLWLGTAAVLLLRGLRGSTVAVPAGLAIVAVSVGKLLLFDLAFLSGISRVLSFIVGGLLVLAMGAGYAQALERSRRSSAEPVDNPPTAGAIPPTV